MVYNQPSLINFLVNKSVNVNLNVINKKGETPLHLAIERNNMAMVKLLLHLGAGLKPINYEGHSPFTMLEDRNMDFLVKSRESDSQKNSISSTKSKPKSGAKGTVKIEIEDTKEEAVDDMFSNMRNYFNQNRGYLSPKNNMETIDVNNSVLSGSKDNDVAKSATTSEDCNVTASDIQPEQVYDLPTFTFKKAEKPYL